MGSEFIVVERIVHHYLFGCAELMAEAPPEAVRGRHALAWYDLRARDPSRVLDGDQNCVARVVLPREDVWSIPQRRSGLAGDMG